MRTRWMKIAAMAACLMMLFAADARAEGTTLAVLFQGLTADGNGSWQMSSLEGVFDVTREGESLGQVNTGGEPLAVAPGSNVTLTPVKDTMPQGYLVDASYTATITENAANRAPVMVYADAGLFRFGGTPGELYTLMDADGARVMDCVVEADGVFTPAQAVPSGLYTLMTPDGGIAAVFEVEPYKGAAEQIAEVTLAREASVAVLASGDEVLLARLGAADGAVLVAMPAGWRVADGAFCLHGQERDYVLLADGVARLRMLRVTGAGDAFYYPLEKTDVEMQDMVVSVMAGEREALAAEVVCPADALRTLPTVGGTVRGVAEPGKRLTLQSEDGIWLAVADEAGQFAFADVTGEGRYRLEAQDGPWMEMDAANALAEQIDMRIPAATEVPTPTPTEAPTAEPTEAPTAEPTEAPTAEPTEAPTAEPTEAPTAEPTEAPTAEPTIAPTEAPQASELGGTSSLTVTVFFDSNNNGERGKYERMLAGTQVKALYMMEGGYLSEAAAGVTDDEGQVTLANMPAGEYVVEVTLPAGYGFTKKGKTDKDTSNFMEENSDRTARSEAFTLAEGESYSIGVGGREMAALSGIIWLDEDANGIKNENEHGQEGVRIQLVDEKNGINYETFSGANGDYAFPQVRPGVYKLRVTAPEGMGFTRYSTTGRENRSVITTEGAQVGVKQYELKSGTVKTLQHVGLIQGATIRVQCFLDANYNGLLDAGEAPLAGVKLELLKQLNGKTVATVTCEEDGTVVFSGLREGAYRLRAVVPEGAAYTCLAEGGNQFRAREGRREYTVDDINVTTGETRDMVVGAILPATISGTAYLDDDFSGLKDDKEKAVSGVVVRLWDAAGNEVATRRTNGKGAYKFEDIVPGQYRLTSEAKKGYAFTKLGAGNVMTNQGAGAGASELFTVALGATLDSMDMGMILPGVVEGVFFADRNDNGLRDAGEGGLVGTVVRLMSEEGEHFSAEIGEDGTFRFDAVMPGKYYLRYELPDHGTVAATAKGGNTLSGDQTGATDWFQFATGDTYEAPLAGGLLLGEISGKAFEDHDGSGAQEAGEPDAPAGLTLTLTPSRKDIDGATTTVGADGGFYFGALRPDTYTLTVSWADGRVMSRTDGLTLPLTPGVAEQRLTIDLAMGDSYTGQQLGGVKPASLSGQAWLDEDNDGAMDAGEARPAGIGVTVIDEATGEVFASLTTDESGAFGLTGIIPGSYTIACTLSEDLVAPLAGDSTFTEAAGRLVMEHVTLDEGGSLEGLRLGLVRLNTLSGNVWVDASGSYMPLAGAMVSLVDASGAPQANVATGEEGAYAFKGLLPGDYYVAVTLPEGYLVVEPGDERLSGGGRRSVMVQGIGRTGQSAAITVEMTENYAGLDIGSVLPGRLGDLCWLDENGNGLQDSGEMGLAGVRIELMRGDQVMAETVSDQYGYWCLKEVYPATYTLRVTPPAEVKPTMRNTQVPAIASVLEESDDQVCLSALVTVVSDKSNYQADLGFTLRQAGVYPEGYGVFETQDWTKILTGE